MKDRNHIEDLFRDEFSGYKHKPSNSSWNNMQSALNNMRLEHLAKVKLGNHPISPAKSVWHKIASKLWWEQFIQFSVLKFNIYYASLAVVGVTTGIAVNTIPNQEVYEPEKQLQVEQLQQLEAYQDEYLVQMEQVVLMNIPKQAAKAPINLSYEQNKFFQAENNAQRKRMRIKLTPSIITLSPGNNSTTQNIENQNNQTAALSAQMNGKTMPLILGQLVPLNSVFNNLSISEYTYRPDTLGLDYLGKPIVKELNFIEQGYYLGTIMLQQEFWNLNPEGGETQTISGNYSQLSYRFGIRFNVVRKNMVMQSGIYLANLNNTFDHTTSHLIIHDTTPHLPYLEYDWPYESDTLIEQRTHRYNNNYSFVELPLLIGTHLENEKFALNIKTGPIIQMISGVNSKLVLSSDNKICTLNKSNFRRPGIRWEISADLSYRLNQNFSIFAEPAYVYDITSMFKSETEVKSRFKGFSAGLGIYYRF